MEGGVACLLVRARRREIMLFVAGASVGLLGHRVLNANALVVNLLVCPESILHGQQMRVLEGPSVVIALSHVVVACTVTSKC